MAAARQTELRTKNIHVRRANHKGLMATKGAKPMTVKRRILVASERVLCAEALMMRAEDPDCGQKTLDGTGKTKGSTGQKRAPRANCTKRKNGGTEPVPDTSGAVV